MTWNYEKKRRRIPEIKLQEREDGRHPPDGQRDVDRGQEFRKCIECFMCQDVCHVIRDHPENMHDRFAGPRHSSCYTCRALEMHPLDEEDQGVDGLSRATSLDRLLQHHQVLYQGLPGRASTITDNAIIPLKERRVDVHYDPLRALGRKLFGGG